MKDGENMIAKDKISDRIKMLREKHNMTQTDLAKELEITRASVNAWEMGVSSPSVPYVIEMSNLFHVSTDYLLGTSKNNMLDIEGLSEKEIGMLSELAEYFRSQKQERH